MNKEIQLLLPCVGCGGVGRHIVTFPPECTVDEAIDAVKRDSSAYFCDTCQPKYLKGGR